MSCPNWDDGQHNWFMGGAVWWRRRLRPWRKFRVCTSCGYEEER